LAFALGCPGEESFVEKTVLKFPRGLRGEGSLLEQDVNNQTQTAAAELEANPWRTAQSSSFSGSEIAWHQARSGCWDLMFSAHCKQHLLWLQLSKCQWIFLFCFFKPALQMQVLQTEAAHGSSYINSGMDRKGSLKGKDT
jgi:hypothetical protein